MEAVVLEGVAFDDEPEFAEWALDGDEAIDPAERQPLDLHLPAIPTDAGFVLEGQRSTAEIKEDLRARNAFVAQRLVDLTGLSHGKVNAEMKRVFALPDVLDKLKTLGLDAWISTPEELGKLQATEITKWAKVVKESGAKVE